MTAAPKASTCALPGEISSTRATWRKELEVPEADGGVWVEANEEGAPQGKPYGATDRIRGEEPAVGLAVPDEAYSGATLALPPSSRESTKTFSPIFRRAPAWWRLRDGADSTTRAVN
jgi:hypothetical protein